jgi:hypothetical protein
MDKCPGSKDGNLISVLGLEIGGTGGLSLGLVSQDGREDLVDQLHAKWPPATRELWFNKQEDR